MTKNLFETGMVLAAGLGTRMRPITDTIPKPLVRVNGKTLLDHALDALADGGVRRAFVNVHYLADQIEEHLQPRQVPETIISDEREELLDSGGGVNKALVLEDDKLVVILNGDSFWIDADGPNIGYMQETWHGSKMDMLLLVATPDQAVGFDGAGDFFMDQNGQLTRRGSAHTAPYIYAGAIVTSVAYLRTISDAKFSLNRLFDRAIQQNRLYGCCLNGLWLHVGTPASIGEAEKAIEQHIENRRSGSTIS